MQALEVTQIITARFCSMRGKSAVSLFLSNWHAIIPGLVLSDGFLKQLFDQ
jgi:hypothetical protein